MTEITEIGIQPIHVPQVSVYKINAPKITPVGIPVHVPIGFPVIQMPCVETRRATYENSALINNDPDGNVILCPAGVPAFEPMNYDPLQIVPVKEESQQRYEDPEIPPAAEVPEAKPETCPPDGAAKVGTKVEEGKREIIKYELVGNRCVTRYKELTIKQQIVDAIPTVPQVIKTGSITLVATTAALSTPILLRAVKPIIQQIVKRIKKILGKEEKALSLSQKRTNAYREKKGLPPLKVKK